MEAKDTRILKDEVTFDRKDMDEQAEISFEAKDTIVETTIKAVLGEAPSHCNQHEKFADECMACHNTCNDSIDWVLFDRLSEIKKAGIKEVVEWIQTQPKIGTGVYLVGIGSEQIYGYKVFLDNLQVQLKKWGG